MNINQINNLTSFLNETKDFAVSKTELDFLINNLYITKDGDKMFLFMFGVFLQKLGTFIADETKQEAIKKFTETYTEPTVELHGAKFQLRKTPQYIIPPDKRIQSFEEKINELNQKTKPFLDEIKDLKSSIKTIEKQLIVEGLAIEGEPKYIPIIL